MGKRNRKAHESSRNEAPPQIQKVGINSKYWRLPLILVPFAFFLRMLIPTSQYFNDWVNSYWMLLSAAGKYPQFTLSASGFPPLTPWYPYYGGGTFNLLSALSDNAIAKFIGLNAIGVYRWSYLLFAIGFTVGLYVLARTFKIPRFFSVTISTAAIASPYYLTNAYGRGDFSEFVAVSSAGFLFGGIALILRPVGGVNTYKNKYAGALMVYFGSYILYTAHSLSLILTITFAIIVLLFALPNVLISHIIAVQFMRKQSQSFLVILCAATFSLVAAFPFLDILLKTGRSTIAASLTPETAWFPEISSLSELFRPYPHVLPRGTPNLDAQTAAPLAIALLIILFTNLRLFRGIQRLRILGSCLAIITATILITSDARIFTILPSPIRAMQFPYRFVTYVTLSIVFLALFMFQVLSVEGKLSTFPILFLCSIVFLISVASGILQASTANRFDSAYPPLTTLNINKLPQTWYAKSGSFASVGSFAPTTTNADVIAVTSPYDGEVEYAIRCHQELAVQFPIFLAPPLGKVTGMDFLGTTTDGFVVGKFANCGKGENRIVKFQEVRSIGKLPFVYFPLASVILLILLFLSMSRNRKFWSEKV